MQGRRRGQRGPPRRPRAAGGRGRSSPRRRELAPFPQAGQPPQAAAASVSEVVAPTTIRRYTPIAAAARTAGNRSGIVTWTVLGTDPYRFRASAYCGVRRSVGSLSLSLAGAVAVGSALFQDPIDDVAAGEQFVLVPWIAARGALNPAVDTALCERRRCRPRRGAGRIPTRSRRGRAAGWGRTRPRGGRDGPRRPR